MQLSGVTRSEELSGWPPGRLEVPALRGWGESPRAGISHASFQELGARDQPNGSESANNLSDEEHQGEAERELPGFALTKDSDAALGRYQKRGALWVAAGSWRSLHCRDRNRS